MAKRRLSGVLRDLGACYRRRVSFVGKTFEEAWEARTLADMEWLVGRLSRVIPKSMRTRIDRQRVHDAAFLQGVMYALYNIHVGEAEVRVLTDAERFNNLRLLRERLRILLNVR